MGIKFANNARTTLATSINDSTTTVVVTDGSLFPAAGAGDYFFATIETPDGTVREIVKVTARATHTLTVIRGQDNTTAIAALAGCKVELRLNAGAITAWLEDAATGTARSEKKFSGDGVTTAFVFTGMVITDPLNLSIHVDGIYQSYILGDYTLSDNGTDTTITFDEAPALATDNIVMLGMAQVASGAASAVDSVNSQTGDVVLDADDIDDTSTTNKFATAAELSKLAGIASGATVYTDEMARDVIGATLVQGSNVTITVDDAANTITIAAAGGGGGGGAVDSVNGATGTVVLDLDDIGDGTTNKGYTSTEKTKLDGIASGATVYTDEMAQDAAAALFTVDDGDIDFTYNDGTPSLTAQIKALAVGTAELADDAVTFAKMQNATAAGFIGATGAGNFSERTPAQVAAALPNATDTANGVVELATDAETETGTDTARAVTPANVTASYIKKSLVTTRGDIITRGASAPQRLALGASGRVLKSDGTDAVWAGQSEIIVIAVGDETTAITTGTAKVTFRMPFAMTLTAVRASLTTASSSGIPTIDINEAGATILSTKLTIDASEKTSTTAATAAVISDTSLADDAEITIDIDVAGTGAAGLKVMLIGTRA